LEGDGAMSKLDLYRAQIYQAIFKWAVGQWRKSMHNPAIKAYYGRLSPHAVMRYLERIEGRDLEAELVTDDLKALIK
jgi:hypothetical protein